MDAHGGVTFFNPQEKPTAYKAMKYTTLFCILTTLFPFTTAFGTTVFSTLTNTNTYNTSNGYVVSGGSGFPYFGQANSFSPSISGTLLSIDLGVARLGGDDGLIDVSLTLDDSLHHIPQSGSLTSGTITSVVGGSANSALTTFVPTGAPVSLVAGEVYWITLTPHDSGSFAAWYNSLVGDEYNFAQTSNGSTWRPTGDPALAFRVNAEVAAVPEPGNLGLITASCLGTVALFGRTVRRRRN